MKYKAKKQKNTRRHALAAVICAVAIIMLAAAAYMIISFLFSGKAQDGGEDTAAAPAETETETETDEKPLVLSGLFSEYETSEALLKYTGDALSSLDYPEFTLCGDKILLWNEEYYESESGSLELVLFDIATGSVAAQTVLDCEFATDIAVYDDVIIIADSGLGLITELDTELNITGQWELTGDYTSWYIGGGGCTLYHVDEGELTAHDLNTGADEVLLASDIELYGSLTGNGGVEITWTDPDTEITCELWLDLESGEITEPEFSGGFDIAVYSDAGWLAQINTSAGAVYYIGGGTDPAIAVLPDGSLSQPDGGDLLLYSDDNGEDYALYDYSGNYVSGCTVAGDNTWLYYEYCIWCEELGGYFLLAYSDEGAVLFFWDISKDTDGGDLELTTYSEYNSHTGGAVSEDLYERADALSETYGIEILIADQCASEYADFNAEQLLDEDIIQEGLDLLEASLADYPDGFFTQLSCFGKTRSVQINLMGTLQSTNSGWETGTYNGFTQEDGDKYVIVVDLTLVEDTIFYHELSHVIDAKLQWDSYCRDDALYSEDEWCSYNPDGFEYTYDYNTAGGQTFDMETADAFIDTYSMISPTEDRAQILGYAMAGIYWVFDEYGGIADKLEYYCLCIRDTFDTTGWPETCAWEAALQ